MTRVRSALSLASVISSLLLLPACGSGDGDAGDSAATEAPDPTGEPSAPSADDDDDGADGVDDDGDADGTSSPTDPGTGDDAGTDAGDTGMPSDDGGPGPIVDVLCGSPAPAGAEEPPPLPTYSGAMCPPVVPGWNVMASSGNAREFLFVAPSDVQPGETLPVIFLWHWLGGSAEDFAEKAIVQEAADQFRFVAVIPAEKGDLPFRWPFSLADSEGRITEELVFFDDMLACVGQSYTVDRSCVSSAGVSAGALFTSQLGWRRGTYLSSIIVLSGGVGGNLVKDWGGSPHVMPAMVLWGGRSDVCIALDFETTSHALEGALGAAGHPIMECIHNCGHSEPPFESPLEGVTEFAAMWRFFLDHPYWLGAGESPYSAGLPEGSPEWCGYGPGSATIRVGECGGSGC
jgi:predicted esterase